MAMQNNRSVAGGKDLHLIAQRLAQGHEQLPHHQLGLMGVPSALYIQVWRPGALNVEVRSLGKILKLEPIDQQGLFRSPLIGHTNFSPFDYHLIETGGGLRHDPYNFESTWTLADEKWFAQGIHPNLHRVMGGRLTTHQGVQGAKFTLWAPHAQGVGLIGDFNAWHPQAHPMRRVGEQGIYELFIPGLKAEDRYMFAVVGVDGKRRYKSDPYALQVEVRPNRSSILDQLPPSHPQLHQRSRFCCKQAPVNIYELHLNSWKRQGDAFVSYREIAAPLTTYCHKMGYTHVELLPIMAHPLDESWGYQVTGFYATSRRYGSMADFQFFVDYLHEANIGVLLDWVPGHFPKDEHGLALFDGTPLYEKPDRLQGYHPKWDTLVFNYRSQQVCNFLIGSAIHYFDLFNIDGLRVDAVSSIVYLDFGRHDGQWRPNMWGGNEDVDGIAFLKQLNRSIHDRFPGRWMIAEKSDFFEGVTSPKGLGFDFKWALGWTHDTLSFFAQDRGESAPSLEPLLHGFSYLLREHQILPLSHDEVAHDRQSLFLKMGGKDMGQKLTCLRLLFGYMMTHPGKKLLFMGGEMAQREEWNCLKELAWGQLKHRSYAQFHRFVQDLNHCYLDHAALWEEEHRIELLEMGAPHLLAFVRGEGQERVICLHHFGQETQKGVTLLRPQPVRWELLLSSDDPQYGGSGGIDLNLRGQEGELSINLPPFTTILIQERSER